MIYAGAQRHEELALTEAQRHRGGAPKALSVSVAPFQVGRNDNVKVAFGERTLCLCASVSALSLPVSATLGETLITREVA